MDEFASKKTGQDVNRETYTVDEVAKMLGISRGLAFEKARTGELPILRFGKRILIPRRAFERMLEECQPRQKFAER